MIVQKLHEIQDTIGFLPREEMENLARRIGTPLYKVQEVASFFPHFKLSPPVPVEVHICRDMSCALRGSAAIRKEIAARARRLQPATAHEGKASLLDRSPVEVKFVSCLGRCDRAPAARVSLHGIGHPITENYLGRNADDLWQVIERALKGKLPEGNNDMDYVPSQIREWQIDVYRGKPEYRAVRQFIENATAHGSNIAQPEDQHPKHGILKMLETAGLLGMGGAGGRTYKKWQDVMEAQGDDKYVVCNADESEPGTFKDREILLRMPHLVVEAMILAALVVGAKKGYVYIRHEYEEAIESVRNAIAAAVAAGHCGERIFGSDYSFDLEVFVSPGGYICGEQSALIQAIEDKRGEPRNRPPELQTNGLWDKPTLVNNVETFAWVPAIVLQDAGRKFAAAGRPGFKGRRLLSISGDVAHPGVYEIANGTTLRELIDMAGGMRGGRPLKAMALSGPSGGFTPAHVPLDALPEAFVKAKVRPGAEFFDLLDFELDIENSRKSRLMFGAGMVAYADGADLVEQARVSNEFYHLESCGKCVPCRIGSRKFYEYAANLESGRWRADEVSRHTAVLKELSVAMEAASICGLGKVAPYPLMTLLKFFPDEFKRRLR